MSSLHAGQVLESGPIDKANVLVRRRVDKKWLGLCSALLCHHLCGRRFWQIVKAMG
jgi:hypothetical protein